jgi:fatty acid/phospholipid biosynthesis enzyme
VSEPPSECRKQIDGVETGGSLVSRDESGGCLLTGQTASGMEAARAWLGLLHGTCEPASRWGGRPVVLLWPAAVVWSENPKRLEP